MEGGEVGLKPPTLRQRKTLPLQPASRIPSAPGLSTVSFQLPVPGLKYYLLLSFPIKQLFVPPFSRSLPLWCVWLRPDSSAVDCLHVSLTPPRLWFSSIDTKGRRILSVWGINYFRWHSITSPHIFGFQMKSEVGGVAGNLKRMVGVGGVEGTREGGGGWQGGRRRQVTSIRPPTSI